MILALGERRSERKTCPLETNGEGRHLDDEDIYKAEQLRMMAVQQDTLPLIPEYLHLQREILCHCAEFVAGFLKFRRPCR
jgi:hypothetical protein